MDSDGEVRTPKIVKALATHNVIQIASGYRHCLALTNSKMMLQILLHYCFTFFCKKKKKKSIETSNNVLINFY